MAQIEMIDLTYEDRNTTAKEELEIEIIYENLPKVQRIEIKTRMRSSNKSLSGRKLSNYKDYLIKEYWELHKFNKCRKLKNSKSKMLKLGYQNKGYKMLTKWGWKPDQGLGNYGQGMIYPIEIEQLTHRMGLGYKNW